MGDTKEVASHPCDRFLMFLMFSLIFVGFRWFSFIAWDCLQLYHIIASIHESIYDTEYAVQLVIYSKVPAHRKYRLLSVTSRMCNKLST